MVGVMYGKHYESLYDGSMVGAGAHVFAVWGYVIAKTRRSRVDLNPKVLAFVIGEREERMVEALEFLCAPDPKSRTKKNEGRRLIREGEYQYFVPNWEMYRRIKDEADRRAYQAGKQAEYRSRSKVAPSSGEVAYCGAVAEHGFESEEAKRLEGGV